MNKPGGRAPSDLWRGRHAKALEGLDETRQLPFEGELDGLRTERTADVVRTVWKILCSTCDNPRSYVVDVSQDINRKAWSTQLRSMTTSSFFYSYSKGRCLIATEYLRALGFPEVDVTFMEPSAVKNLAGEAMAPPAIALALLPVIAASACWANPLVEDV